MSEINSPPLQQLLGDAPVTPRPRTPAQIRASRENGRRSRGPVTAEGRARSAQNSRKHGLLARRSRRRVIIASSTGFFGAPRAQLVEEFHPRSFSENCEIDALAHDMTRVARRLVESAARPAHSLTGEETARLEEIRPRKHLARLIKAVLAQPRFPGAPLFRLKDAQTLAQDTAAFVGGLLIDDDQDHGDGIDGDDASLDILAPATKPVGEAAPPAPPASAAESPAPPAEQPPAKATCAAKYMAQVERDEREEQENLQRLVRSLGFSRETFCDSSYLAAFLAGNSLPARREWKRLHSVLRLRLPYLGAWLGERETVETSVARVERANLAKLAAEPQTLILLERYLSRLDNAIGRKLARLRKQRQR